MDADPDHRPGALHPIPDIARQVFQGRQAQALDSVEEFVIEGASHLGDPLFEQPRSITMPVSGSCTPRTVTSARNECP